MKFWKIFLASLIAFVVGFVGIFIYLIGSGVSALMQMDNTAKTPTESVLYIDLAENIVDTPATSLFSGLDPLSMTVSQPISLLQALTAIEHAASNPSIKGICIQQDGIGNISGANIEELRAAIAKFKESGKFVIAYDDSYTQSEYYLASVADEVLLQPEGSLEWRGLGFELMFYKGLLDKLGAKADIFRPSVCKYKSAVEPYFLTEMSDANREQLQALADGMWSTLVEAVAISRKQQPEQLKTIAANLNVALPEDALKYGLVDRLAYEDELFELFEQSGVKRNNCGGINRVSLGEYIANELINNVMSVAIGDDNAYDFVGDKPLVALIYAEGEVIDGNEKVEGQIVGNALAREIRQARLNENTKAVVLRVNSPGGSALASDIVWREMELLQETKPIVVSMGDYAASGGYYISCPADYIVANRLTLTGSIGVFAMMVNVGDVLKKHLGITFDKAATSPSANGIGVINPLTEQQRQMIHKSVDKIYETFTENVAKGRNMTIEEVYNIAEGRVWSGKDAVENGLADMNGGLNEAIAMAADLADLGDNFTLYEFSAILTPFEEWLNSMGGYMASSYGVNLDMERKQIIDMYREYHFIFENHGIMTKVPYDIVLTL